jgi:23S rRNA pseudouridine2605 synthase
LLTALKSGVLLDGKQLSVRSARQVRAGSRNAWLEIVLDAGHNRHIRRLLAAFDVSVLRLVRVAVGPLALGALPQGKWRALTEQEIRSL